MYFLYVVVGVCLWRERRRLAMWLVFLTATAAIVGMGLVVVNAGALYRLRYVFWIMLIVIAAQGLVGQLELRVSRKGAKRNAMTLPFSSRLCAFAGNLFNGAPHQSDEVLNVFFRRIKRAHQPHFGNRFVPRVKEILLL